MPSNESKKADIERAVAKLKEVIGKIKEDVQSLDGRYRPERAFLLSQVEGLFSEYRYHERLRGRVPHDLQDALRNCSWRPRHRVVELTDIAEAYINPFLDHKLKPNIKLTMEIIDEALKAAMEIEVAWRRTEALAYVCRVLKIIDPEKAKEIRDEVLKTVDEHLSDEERKKDTELYGSALVHAVEIVSLIDAERALSMAEKIGDPKWRASALIHVLESYIYYLFMMGVKV